jgi:hypothetical protein
MEGTMMTSHQARVAISWATIAIFAATGCTLEDGRPAGAWAGDDDVSEELPDEPLPDDPEIPPTSKIYGGTPVEACGWPTTVSLGGSCSGTLVHPEVVIYAAHCGASYGWVRFGEHTNQGPGRWVQTSECKTYPGGGPGKGNDFAYCRLAEPVNDVPIVPILMGCETQVLQPGKAVTLVGFGHADNGPYGVKREVTTTLHGITNAGEAFIGGNGKDTCQGDSGGPAFVELDDGTWRVFGVTSYGGACGGGGYYSIMHRGIQWFEQQTGLDLTPCHDTTGAWDPDERCSAFPFDPASGTGAWGQGCGGGPLSGPSTTCGANDQGGPPQDPVPDACAGCTTHHGSLAGTQDSEVQPDGDYYYAAAGQHRGVLSGPADADFDLYLYRWNGSGWQVVASATTASSDETIVHQGSAGYYAWLVSSYAGSGPYTLLLDLP